MIVINVNNLSMRVALLAKGIFKLGEGKNDLDSAMTGAGKISNTGKNLLATFARRLGCIAQS